MSTVKEILIRISEGWELSEYNITEGIVTLYNPNMLDDSYDEEMDYFLSSSEATQVIKAILE